MTTEPTPEQLKLDFSSDDSGQIGAKGPPVGDREGRPSNVVNFIEALKYHQEAEKSSAIRRILRLTEEIKEG